MSTVEVEQPTPIEQSSPRGLATDDVEFTGYGPAPRRTSIAAIINVDDDNSESEWYTGPGRSDNSSMSAERGSPVPVAGSDPVIVVEDPRGETRGNGRARNGAPSRPIIVLDSDEEQSQPSGPADSNFRRRSGVRRRGGGSSSSSFRIFSPPPPPPQRHRVPPVPFLPPIIAEPAPFAILHPPVNNVQQSQSPLDRPFDSPAQSRNNAAHSSNSGNGIQLGGGLISQGNGVARRHASRAHIRLHPRRSESFDELFAESDDHAPLERASRIFGRFFASYLSGNTFISRPSNQNPSNPSRNRSRGNVAGFHVHHVALNDDEMDWDGGDDAMLPGAGFFGVEVFDLGPWGRRDVALGLGPDYDKRMTHPQRAGPGWTYDFGTEQEEGGSKADGSEILVCAKCLDPLLANADGMVDVSEQEKKGRRVWSLRCGHVLDGKCVATLMVPEDLSKKDIHAEQKRKGKEEEERQVDLELSGEKVDVTSLDVKGKGKAPVSPTRAPTPPLDHKENSPTPPPFTGLEDSLPSENTSIRSRLRHRRTTIVPSSSAATSSSTPRRSVRHSATSNSRGGPSSTRRRGTKRKRAPHVVAEVIEARHEWMCPVSGCGRRHVSVKAGGLWKMDPDDGAIGIFV